MLSFGPPGDLHQLGASGGVSVFELRWGVFLHMNLPKRRLHYPCLSVELECERFFILLIQSILEYGEFKY
jgi:hypothetical protein